MIGDHSISGTQYAIPKVGRTQNAGIKNGHSNCMHGVGTLTLDNVFF